MENTTGFEKQIIDKIESTKKSMLELQKRIKKINFDNKADFNEWKNDLLNYFDSNIHNIDEVLKGFEDGLLYLPTF